MIKKVGKSEHFFVTHKNFLKNLALFYHFFGKKQALLLAFNAFFTSTFGKSLSERGNAYLMSCLDDSDDHLRWLAPTDLNLDYMGITHLDCVTRVIQVV